MDNAPLKPVRVSSYGGMGNGGSRTITIDELTEQELDRLRGMLLGGWWVRGSEGRLQFEPGYLPAPQPTEDGMLPEWRAPNPADSEAEYQMELLAPRSEHSLDDGSIIIQHLCGYSYTANGYRSNAVWLERYGFHCLRSRRGDDNRFWEVWLLPGVWAAKDELKAHLDTKPKGEKLDALLQFIRTRVSFGTLDVSVQRMCQVLD